MTVFIVGRFTSVNQYERLMDFGNGAGIDNLWIGRHYSSNDLMCECIGWGSGVLIGGAVNDGNWHLWMVRIKNSSSSSTLDIYYDSSNPGMTKTSAASVAARTVSSNYIGRSNWNDPYLDGQIRELCIYNYAASDTQMTNTYTALRSAWEM